MENKITLTKVEGYQLYKPRWDGGGSDFVGYYKDKKIALSLAEKEGGYEPSGNVVESENLYTDGEKIYHVNVAGKGLFNDENNDVKDKFIADIKKKLTDSELELLGIK